MARAWLLTTCGVWSGGCVYYNAMWSAERSARAARGAEAAGQPMEARGHWLRAAAKAESVHVRHPASRWADDAWVLHAEGLARGASCAQARQAIAGALAEASNGALLERVALIAGECALALGRPLEAEAHLVPALASNDAAHRSRAALLAGRGARARGDLDGSARWYRQSRERAAGPALVGVLFAAGRVAEGFAALDSVTRRRFDATGWGAMLDAAAGAGGQAAASEALDRALAHAPVPPDERAKLLQADGDRWFAAGDPARARVRYEAAARAARDPAVARTAEVRIRRVAAAGADSVADIIAVAADVRRMNATEGGAGPEAASLAALLERVASPVSGMIAEFSAAELARDSLGAPRLAGRLFLAVAERYPDSLFAAKALIAALPLLPERHDSIMAALERAHGASPYVLAIRGTPTPAYAALEDSLARALGVARPTSVAAVRARVRAPTPGPRGPWWDVAFRGDDRVPAADSAAADADERAPRRPDRRPGRPAERPRPTVRP